MIDNQSIADSYGCSVPNHHDDTENRIVEAAKKVFIDKGFDKASMGDIAAQSGIKRSTLHYYFRTKDRLFEAAISSIIGAIIPRLLEIMLSGDHATVKISRVVDVYFETFRRNPSLPFFVLGEIRRDVDHLIASATAISADRYLAKVRYTVISMMESGEIAKVPIPILFVNFFGLITFPFLARNIIEGIVLEDGDEYDAFLADWKPRITSQLLSLLEVKQPG